MKKLPFIFFALAASCLSCWAFISVVSSSFEVPKEGITFHEVQLVCAAATDIGCGSRSKPILLDLEKEATIKEAWLNRQGTVIAIVWEKEIEPNVKAVPSIFKKHGKPIETLKGSAYQEQLSSFKVDKWYKGVDVNELSMEEAGRIAHQIIDPIVKDGILSKDDAPKMIAEVETYIQKEFMTLEDVSLLSTTTYYDQWEKDIKIIGEKYIPKGKMPDIEMCSPTSSSCTKNGKATCTKNKKSCCSKSSS